MGVAVVVSGFAGVQHFLLLFCINRPSKLRDDGYLRVLLLIDLVLDSWQAQWQLFVEQLTDDAVCFMSSQAVWHGKALDAVIASIKKAFFAHSSTHSFSSR